MWPFWASVDINTRDVERILDSYANPRRRFGLYNCLEFSQPLSCLYPAMQTRKTFSFNSSLYRGIQAAEDTKTSFPATSPKTILLEILFVVALLVCYTAVFRVVTQH